MAIGCLASKAQEERQKRDLYHTPFSLTWKLLKKHEFSFTICEPACGKGSIVTFKTEWTFN